MELRPLEALPDVKLIKMNRHQDDRGYFSETFRVDELEAAGVLDSFVQENESLSNGRGTVRGLHFQVRPFAQAKLVRVLAGAILDVVVDLRRSSPTFGRAASVRLESASSQQLYIPIGFAHGFCTLEDNVLISYKVSAYYNRASDRSLLWNDPALVVDWPVGPTEAILSNKDRTAPLLKDIVDLFD